MNTTEKETILNRILADDTILFIGSGGTNELNNVSESTKSRTLEIINERSSEYQKEYTEERTNCFKIKACLDVLDVINEIPELCIVLAPYVYQLIADLIKTIPDSDTIFGPQIVMVDDLNEIEVSSIKKALLNQEVLDALTNIGCEVTTIWDSHLSIVCSTKKGCRLEDF